MQLLHPLPDRYQAKGTDYSSRRFSDSCQDNDPNYYSRIVSEWRDSSSDDPTGTVGPLLVVCNISIRMKEPSGLSTGVRVKYIYYMGRV